MSFFTKKLIIIPIALFALMAWLRFAYLPMARQERTFYLPAGKGLHYVLANLAASGELAYPMTYRFFAKFLVDTHHLHQGEYSISTQDSFYDLLKKMQRGLVNTHPVTLLEGWTLSQILSALERQPWLQDLNNVPANSLIIKDLEKNYGSAEGWFFPDTYFASRGDSAEQILINAHHKMDMLLSDYWSKRSPDCYWHSPYEALIAASLVERETAYDPEKPQIARVIINRLQKDMPLQIDSAVAYGLSHEISDPGDLKKPGPYNTYLNKGLPPSPIGAVSVSSLQAVFHPVMSEDLYFVARGRGRHRFSKTFSEHHLAVLYYKNYLKQHDLDYFNQLTGLEQCPILLP